MLDPQNYEQIRLERLEDGVLLATLNRPERLNAMNDAMRAEYRRLPGEFDADLEARVLVVTGAGRAFCAGGDFQDFRPDQQDVSHGVNAMMRHALRVVDNLLDCEKPVISAVNGYALGLGCTVALLSDVVVAARSAQFGDTHVHMGMGAGDGGQLLLPLLMGPSRAKYYLMTGERFDAEEAERLGVVNFVVDDDQLMDRTMEIARKLARGPAYAIMASKVPLNKWLKMMSNLVMPLAVSMEEVSMTKGDHQEATRAFREKREPRFTGR